MDSFAASYTERSWGIDLIHQINKATEGGVYPPLTGASGERGLKGTGGASTLFPDVLLFSGEGRFLMGWELKFPDTEVTDSDTIDNAKEKALRLGTNSFLIWNVNQAVLYVQDSQEKWNIAASWSIEIPVDRASVHSAKSQWIALMHRILKAIVDIFAERSIRDADRALTVGETTYAEILRRVTPAQEHLILQECNNDRTFNAEVRTWAIEATAIEAKVDDAAQARILAQSQIVNWINKLVFSHHLKRESEDAFIIDTLDESATPDDYLNAFDVISANADFKSIYNPILGQRLVSPELFGQLKQLQAWLVELTRDAGGHFDFSSSLAGGLAQIRSKVSGQFSTPPLLARLLVGLTVVRPRTHVIDPCCGTGTIARAVFDLKQTTGDDPSQSAATTWASDKFSVPVGFAGIALADPKTLGQVQQVFRSDVSALRSGDPIMFTDPVSGDVVYRGLPKFGAVVSNLPFVRFENLNSSQDKSAIFSFSQVEGEGVDAKSDLYAYILLGLQRLIDDNGRIGVIISNSWLGTGWGSSFREQLLKFYDIEYLVLSGQGRWFANADVVTTLMVLTKRGHGSGKTIIARTNSPIQEWTDKSVDDMIQHLLARDIHAQGDDVTFATVDRDWLLDGSRNGLYWGAGLGGSDLLRSLQECTSPASKWFSFTRGSRPGWEKMFFIAESDVQSSGVDSSYLRPFLHRPAQAFKNAGLRGVKPNFFLFDCALSPEELSALGHHGTIDWINRFQHQVNGRGIPLPQALKGKPQWYSIAGDFAGDFVLQMNPDAVLAVYRPLTETVAVSQRFIPVRVTGDIDKDLAHALLNSSVTYLWQEITGFPKGLGALDRNATSLKKYLRIPDPMLIDEEGRTRILQAFSVIADRPPLPIHQELEQDDRHQFDQIVLDCLGLGDKCGELYQLILDLVTSRRSVTEPS